MFQRKTVPVLYVHHTKHRPNTGSHYTVHVPVPVSIPIRRYSQLQDTARVIRPILSSVSDTLFAGPSMRHQASPFYPQGSQTPDDDAYETGRAEGIAHH